VALVSARRSLLALAALSIFAALPATAAAPPFNEFPLPVANSQPRGITAGPDGALWFTEFIKQKIGRITTDAAHTLSEFPLPPPPAPGGVPLKSGRQPRGIAAGPDGAIWFTEYTADMIGRIDPTTHAISEFAVPTPLSQPRAIAAGPDGAMWFTEFGTNKIGRIDPKLATPGTSNGITEFSPTAGSPRGIVAGPDNAMWFADDTGNAVGRIPMTATRQNPQITEFPVPTNLSSPRGIAVGPDGALWFAEAVGKIGRIDPALATPGTSNGITEVPVPTQVAAPGIGPDGIAAGPDHAMWFVELTAAQLGRIDATTHAVTEVPVPTPASKPDSIALGPDKAMWFTESSGPEAPPVNRIGCFAISGSTLTGACVSAVPGPSPTGTGTGTGTTGTGTTPGTTPGKPGAGGVTPLSGKALAKKLAACAQLKGTARAQCLAQAHYGAALARCETRKGKKAKASCRKKALIAYKRELAAIKCQSIKSKSNRAACLRKARRIH
jgi:virginiamycin B lyase